MPRIQQRGYFSKIDVNRKAGRARVGLRAATNAICIYTWDLTCAVASFGAPVAFAAAIDECYPRGMCFGLAFAERSVPS